ANEADTTRVADGNTELWAAKLCERRANRASAGVRTSSIRSCRRPSSTTTPTPRIAQHPVLEMHLARPRARTEAGQTPRTARPVRSAPACPLVFSPHPCRDGVGRGERPAHRLGPTRRAGGYRSWILAPPR